MSNHTPGPWRTSGHDIQATDDRRTIICEMTGSLSNPDARADARLIAAAPKMYELLRLAVDANHTKAIWDWSERKDEARALLAKIDGGAMTNAERAQELVDSFELTDVTYTSAGGPLRLTMAITAELDEKDAEIAWLREAIKVTISDAESNCGKHDDARAERCAPYLDRELTCPDCPMSDVEDISQALAREDSDG